MYKATVIETFIATPGDVIKERGLIRDIINEWNIINSKNRNAVLKDIGWENDVYSSFTEGRAQESINKQILEQADLLIAVFWTRIGTPTGDFISGSVEEITKHINSNKPVMLFFSKAPVRLDSVDSKQYENLLEFKKWCQNKGLVNEYETEEEFIKKLRIQFGLLMNKDEKILSLIGIKNGEDEPEIDISPKGLDLSDNAIQLLKEISQDGSGMLMAIMTLGGYQVQTNGKSFGTERYDARAQAEINETIEELERYDLIRPTNYKREMFTITANGYKFADQKKA